MSYVLPDNLDVLTFSNASFSDPLVNIQFVWMILAMIFNVTVITKSLFGWLINPRITRQVVAASSLAVIYTANMLIQIFVAHRAFALMSNWAFYIMTLFIVLQHFELLKLFTSLSTYWTVTKCRNLQIVVIVLHVLITFPEYIWPFGLEKNAVIMEVLLIN